MVPGMSATPPEQDAPASSSVVEPTQPVVAPAPAPPPLRCQDCGSVVTGRYCAECGQPAEVHMLSLHDVAHDVVHSALHLDSRVWRTLHALVLQPGELTNAFIRGQRQRYLPPFRLYLILSVMFFAVSALLPSGQWLHVNEQGDTVVAYGPSSPEGDGAPVETPEAANDLQIDVPGADWLGPRLEAASQKAMADRGRRLGNMFIQTAPKLMFFFLPLMAAVALLFYWRPRRLYAEHLVFFLHAHAFVFLWLTATSVNNAVASLDLPLVGLLGIVTLVLMAYLPWYVFRAMRVVYGEGRLRTGLKFTALSFVYFVLLGITMLAGVVYSMLSL
jgi:hypothetical protein